MKAPSVHVAVRLDPALLARVDTLIPLYSTPWRKAKRSDALRALTLAGLEVEEPRARASATATPAAKSTAKRSPK